MLESICHREVQEEEHFVITIEAAHLTKGKSRETTL